MPPKEREPRTADKLTNLPHYSNEAMLKMVNVLFDPSMLSLSKELGIKDEANLLSLTRINSSREIFVWAKQITREAALNPHRQWKLGRIFRTSFLFARRSIDMKAFTMGIGLAQEQNIAKSEESGEEYDA